MLRTVHLVGGWCNIIRRWMMRSHQKHEHWKRAMLALSVTIFVVVQGLLLLERCMVWVVSCLLMWTIDRILSAIFPRVVILAYISGRRTSERTSGQWGVVDWQAVSLFHVTRVTSGPLFLFWLFLLGGFVLLVSWFVFPRELLMTSFWLVLAGTWPQLSGAMRLWRKYFSFALLKRGASWLQANMLDNLMMLHNIYFRLGFKKSFCI